MKNKVIKIIIACIVVAGIGFGGYYGYNKFSTKNVTVASNKSYAVSVSKKDLTVSVQGTGAAYAGTTKDVVPNNAGTIKSLTVKVGDKVTKGQKLFTSYSSDLEQKVTSAQNDLTKANLTLESDESAQKVDDNKVASDKISVTEATTALTQAKTAVTNMAVKSPFAGIVTAVNSATGDNAETGTAVLTVVDMDSMKVKVSVDELDIEKIKVNQEATIKFDAISGKTYEGTVESVAQAGTTTNNVTTYDVVVGIKDSDGIKLGMNANVTIDVESKQDALVVPAEALVEQNGEKYVRVENSSSSTDSSSSNTNSKNGTTNSASNYKLVAIKTGMETEDYIEVTSGVTEGQKVIVQLAQSTSSNSNKNSSGNGFGGGMNGGMGGGMSGGGNMGGSKSQGSGTSNSGSTSSKSGSSTGSSTQSGNSSSGSSAGGSSSK